MAASAHDRNDVVTVPPTPAVIDDLVRPLADAGLDDRAIWSVVEAAPDGIVMADASGKILLVNQRTEELFGYDRGELLGKSVDLLLPEDMRAAHTGLRAGYVANPRTRSMGAELDLCGRRRDGTEFPVEISLSPLSGANGVAVIATVRDITDRLAVESEHRRIRHRLVRIEDRERIARDLHDTVIQRLFVAGMTLHSAAGRTEDVDLQRRIAGAIDDLDTTISEIRTAIFGLQSPDEGRAGLRGELVRLTTDVEAVLGFVPRMQFDGIIEGIHPDVADQMLPVLREALANIARHAQATEVRIIVEVGTHVRLGIFDNGVGIPDDAGGGHGLVNMASRAKQLGGTFVAESGPDGGSILEWRVPAEPTRAAD